jgi:diacylglycerol kinase family enzyme
MAGQRLHLIHNASSGAFMRGLVLDVLRGKLESAGWEISGETDLEQGDLPDSASLAGNADALAIAGGDGSIKAVLNALAGQEGAPPALILPCGTANLLARHVHTSIDLDTIIERSASATARPLLLGDANGHVFAVAAAVGVSPALVKFREDIRKLGFWGRVRRSLASLRVGWRSMFRQPFLARTEGEAAPRRATAIYATCPDTPVTEGQFLVFGGRMRNVADLLSGLAMAALPVVDESGRNWTVETRQLQIRSMRPLPVILDGEPHTLESPLTLEFGRKCAEVIVT